MPDLAPVFQSQVAGFSQEPGLTIINETLAYMCGTNFPWKWNEIILPPFYTSSYQQDYAGINPNGSSIENLGWLQAGDVLDVNNTAVPKAQPQVEVVRNLPRVSNWVGMPPMFFGPLKFEVCWLYNNQLYYGTWGAANAGNTTRGNNPQAQQTITSPTIAGNAMPVNPITQIQDANGNYLVLTTFGITGNSAPSAAANATPGTTVNDGSCVWTVVDPVGAGYRIFPVPSQSGTVWQFNLRGQAKPPAPLTSLSTNLAPIPDEYMHVFRQGCITTAYRYSPEARVRAMYGEERRIWVETLMEGRMQGDREPEECSFVPSGGIVAPVSGQAPRNPGNPFGWNPGG